MAHAAPLPRVAILGIGSVGGIIAAALESAQRSVVTLVARGKCLDVLRTKGLNVKTFEGEHFQFDFDGGRRVWAMDDVTAHDTMRHQDFLLVATKAHQLTSVLGAFPRLVGPQTTIVPCTNGLPFWFHHKRLASTDPDGRLAREINTDQVLGCVGMISGGVLGEYERWESHWPSEKNTLLLGEPGTADYIIKKESDAANILPSPSRASRLAALFEGSDVRVGVSETEHIRDRIFDKILINCSVNSIGALTGADIGQTCFEGSSSDSLLRHLVAEAIAVAAALDPPLALEHTAESILAHYRGTYGLRSSMLQDVSRGRPTEKNEIVRSVVELGAAHGVATPRLEMAADLLDTVERVGGSLL
jgi:2-dehydropantoate 2-reductase